jgi:hypothetical protein
MKKLLKQELKSYTPEWDAKCSIITDIIIMISSFSIGITLIYYSKRYIWIEIKYTTCINDNYDKSTKICTIPFKIDKTIKSPIFIYYKLENFFLNHRNLVESKNYKELRGEDTDTKMNCKNSYLMSEMFGKSSPYYLNEWNHNFSETDISSPCGLLARCFFNDTYNLTFSNGTYINISEYGISNEYLKKKFFKRNKDYKTKQWIDVENEHFINWMNIETFYNFKKIWGKIDFDLKPGNYNLIVKNNYDIKKYEADKYFCISNANTFGINNLFGYFFVGIGIYLFLVILILWVKYLLSKESKEVNINKLKWY